MVRASGPELEALGQRWHLDLSPIYTIKVNGEHKPWCSPSPPTWRAMLLLPHCLLEFQGWFFPTMAFFLCSRNPGLRWQVNYDTSTLLLSVLSRCSGECKPWHLPAPPTQRIPATLPFGGILRPDILYTSCSFKPQLFSVL